MPEGRIHKKRPEGRTRETDKLKRGEKKQIDDLGDRFSTELDKMKKFSSARLSREVNPDNISVAESRVSQLMKDEVLYQALNSEWEKIKQADQREQDFRIVVNEMAAGDEPDALGFSELLLQWDDLIDPFDIDKNIDAISIGQCGAEILKRLVKIKNEKIKSDKIGSLVPTAADWVFVLAKNVGTVVNQQLKNLANGIPIPVANPAEALIDQCFKVASLREYNNLVKDAEIAKKAYDLNEPKVIEWKRERSENKVIVDQMERVIDGNEMGNELKQFLEKFRDKLDNQYGKISKIEKSKGDSRKEKTDYDKMEFSKVYEDFVDFLSDGKLSEKLATELEFEKSRLDSFATRLNNYLSDFNNIKNRYIGANKKVADFDSERSDFLGKLAATNDDLKGFWKNGVADFDAQVKRLEKAATDNKQKTAIKNFRSEVKDICSSALKSIGDDFSNLQRDPSIGGAKKEVNLVGFMNSGEQILRIAQATIARIDNLEATLADVGGSNKKQISSYLHNLNLHFSAILMRTGSTLIFFYGVKMS